MEKTVFLCVSYHMILVITGELVFERSPVCPGDSAAYRCSVSAGRLEWIWTTMSGQRQQLSLISGSSQVGVQQLTLDRVTLIFNITEISPSNINVIATVDDPLSLNLTTMECNGQSLTITIRPTNFLPVSLTVSSNGSEVNIDLNVEGSISNIYYQLSEGSIMAVTQSIIISLPENITFTSCQKNTTFTIDSCILDDQSDKERNYTLFSNGMWLISRSCSIPDIYVICINGNWSENIHCPDRVTSDLMSSTKFSTISGPNTTPEKEEFTAKVEQCMTQSPQNCQTYRQIVGSVIGSFAVAFILGSVLGLLCGAKYTRSIMTDKPFRENPKDKNNINIHKGPQYEDIKLDDNVELSGNVSYDVVRKI